MKKVLKIVGLCFLGLVGVIVLVLILAYCFREELIDYVNKENMAERVELLKSSNYSSDSDNIEYCFSYPQDSIKAAEIVNYFQLDTLVSESATTWDNALSLARFVARNIPHENQTIQPEKRNAIALWEYTRNVEPAFNCRLHSIMLHELLSSVGIKNRFVTCLPQDSLDSDCHVVNLVWLKEMDKWAMLDSDMQAWINTPDDETPLSLAEIRELTIKGQPMIMNPLLDKEPNSAYYFSYLAKNLYWFQCWNKAGYDIETDLNASYEQSYRKIALCPNGFGGFRLGKDAVVTRDDVRFWAKPNE